MHYIPPSSVRCLSHTPIPILLMQVSTVCAKDAASPQPHVFRTREQGVEYYVDHRKGEFFIVTNANSMNYKVCVLAIVNKGWSTVLTTGKESSLLLLMPIV